MYHVICCDCHIAGRDASARGKAIESWNTRPIEESKDKEIKRLREALEFYAAGKGHVGYDEYTKEFYEAYDNGDGITEQPLGCEAREALKGGNEPLKKSVYNRKL